MISKNDNNIPHSDDKKVIENDWLGLNIIFYNENTLKYSTNINDVIDFNQFEWDYEALYNYLDWGYCILGKTPIKGVKFLQANEYLLKEDNQKRFILKKKEWDAEFIFNAPAIKFKPDEVIEMIREDVKSWERFTQGTIVLPLSGGFDSRLLASMVTQKERIKCFSYGSTFVQSKDREVLYAQKVAHQLNLQWKYLELNHFHCYLNDWYNAYGISTFAGGLYHYEFYEKIKLQGVQSGHLLSGIVGDAWAGKFVKPILSPKDIAYLKLTHGYYVEKKFFTFKYKKENEYIHEYFEKNRLAWELPSFRLIELIRHKMIFLNYLFRTPYQFNLIPYSPYVKSSIALAMISIDEKLRLNRYWQKEYFKKCNLDVENQVKKYQKLNYLACYNLKKKPLPLLKAELFKEIINSDYINQINNKIQKAKFPYYKFFILQNLNNLFMRLNIIPRDRPLMYPFYLQYLVLIPLQLLILKRDEQMRESRN
jgi:hypothetical protein